MSNKSILEVYKYYLYQLERKNVSFWHTNCSQYIEINNIFMKKIKIKIFQNRL